jgi:hypothetical protein
VKEETRQHLSQLILEELAENIKSNEGLRRKLEIFTDLPVEKVAQAIIKQFEYLLSSELRELIIHLIEQDIAFEQTETTFTQEDLTVTPQETPAVEESKPPDTTISEMEELNREIEAMTQDLSKITLPPEPVKPAPVVEEPREMENDTESIMAHFAVKELFPTESMKVTLQETDWLYFYGFTYAPNSTGKGELNRRIGVQGIDKNSDILLMDNGDIRVFLSPLQKENYTFDKTGKPTLTSQRSSQIRFEHERIVNILRAEEVLLPVPFWSIVQGHGEALRIIEAKYVNILRTLIDVHDAVEWDVDVMAFDDFIMQLPSIADAVGNRTPTRQSRHQSPKSGVDIRKMERIIFREKSLAQEIHNELLLLATKNKIDYMVRLDSAIMGDWKSILSARYHVGKDKRRTFCQTIVTLQKKYAEYQLMFKTMNPVTRFSLFE